MEKYVIIDSRMRQIEKDFFKSLGYNIIELEKSEKVYTEISSHVDIFACQIDDILICEKSIYDYLKKEILNSKIICGESEVQCKYPNDVKYNVCQIGRYTIHNFKFTDIKISKIIDDKQLKKIQVSQGYTNCSTAIIDENSIVTNDKGIFDACIEEDIDSLFINVDDGEIKLLNGDGSYSNMRGFIGGCISRLGDNVMIFGDIKKLKDYEKIYEFMRRKNIKIITFKDEDLIDYGGLIEVEL